jgi:diadenosine tetraphosphate (Ap4A) HIT family hydrolase
MIHDKTTIEFEGLMINNKCDCIDCKIYRGELIPPGGIIFKNDKWVLNHAEKKIPGHLILKPIKHYLSIAEFDQQLTDDLGWIFKWINNAILSVCKPDKVYTASFGDRFPYVHFHFIPRYNYMPPLASTVLTNFDSGLYNCTDDEINNIVSRIRSWISENNAAIHHEK